MGSRGLRRAVLVLSVLVAVLASEFRDGNAYNTYINEGRNLAEGQNDTKAVRSFDRIARTDPLNGFKKYRGGYNITNKHYWSSTIFTGIYGYSIALLCLLSGLVYAGILLVTTVCCINKGKKCKSHPCTKGYRLWLVPIGVILTLLAIIASGVEVAGSSRFNSRANSVKRIIDKTAKQASATIYNVSRSVEALQGDAELYGAIQRSTSLTAASLKLNSEASRIQRKAEKAVRRIGKGLKILHAIALVTVSLNLVSILALLGSGFLKVQWPFRKLIVISWLLTILFWAQFGLYFFLDRFAGDTCVALDEYQQDPRNSSLGTILPCNDQLSVKSALRVTRAGIHDLIDQVNANISSLKSSGSPSIAYICNPFSAPPHYNYQPGHCSAGEIQIGDIPQVLKKYTCSDGDGKTCGNGEFISASQYGRVLIYTTSVQNILNSFPGMERLVNCQLIKDAFSDILSTQCSSFKRYAHMAWAAMAALSTIMSLLILTWAVTAHHDSKNHSSNVNSHVTKHIPSLNVDTNNQVSGHKEPPSEP